MTSLSRVVSQAYPCIKTHHAVPFKYMQLIVYQLYLSKATYF